MQILIDMKRVANFLSLTVQPELLKLKKFSPSASYPETFWVLSVKLETSICLANRTLALLRGALTSQIFHASTKARYPVAARRRFRFT